MQAIQAIRASLASIQDDLIKLEVQMLLNKTQENSLGALMRAVDASEDDQTQEDEEVTSPPPKKKTKIEKPAVVATTTKTKEKGLDDSIKKKLLPYLDDPSQSPEKFEKMLAIVGPENKEPLKNLINNYKAALRRNPNVLPHQNLRN